MNDREQAPERADASAETLRRAMHEAKELVRALENTSTRRVLVRVGNTEISVEHETGVAPAGESRTTAPVPAAARPGFVAIVAPLVGVFYRASSPNAKPFVDVGDSVEPGQVIGMIEAMKVMNQVTSDYRGSVVEILAENASTVQYEQPLVLIDTGKAAGSASPP
jgi:acetyl-CoA carboxylase biotin carboxyl carrier protein